LYPVFSTACVNCARACILGQVQAAERHRTRRMFAQNRGIRATPAHHASFVPKKSAFSSTTFGGRTHREEFPVASGDSNGRRIGPRNRYASLLFRILTQPVRKPHASLQLHLHCVHSLGSSWGFGTTFDTRGGPHLWEKGNAKWSPEMSSRCVPPSARSERGCPRA
jgi:hypothetical protein